MEQKRRDSPEVRDRKLLDDPLDVQELLMIPLDHDGLLHSPQRRCMLKESLFQAPAHEHRCSLSPNFLPTAGFYLYMNLQLS